jgi:hypothetical protein
MGSLNEGARAHSHDCCQGHSRKALFLKRFKIVYKHYCTIFTKCLHNGFTMQYNGSGMGYNVYHIFIAMVIFFHFLPL